MNRSDLFKELIVKFPEIDSKDIEFAVRLIFKEMASALAKGKRIEVRNFGILYSRTRGYARYLNPRTGELVKKNPVKYVRFKEGKDLKRRMNSSELRDFTSDDFVN